MDTFAYRNANPAITVFELDLPKTQAYKQERLKELAWKSAGKIHFVPVDFAKDELEERLMAAGFSMKTPTFFSLLGVAYYLSYPVLAHFLGEIGALATAGDQFVFDFPDETTFSKRAPERVRELAAITESLGEPMQPGCTLDEIWRALHEAGFAVSEHEPPSGVQQRFFGHGTSQRQAFENIHFILAEKQPMN